METTNVPLVSALYSFYSAIFSRDNEIEAEYIFTKTKGTHLELEWSVVRSTELTDGSSSKYELFDKPQDPLFGVESVTTRVNVAESIVDMIMTQKLGRNGSSSGQ